MTMLLDWELLRAVPRGPRKRTARDLTDEMHGQGFSIDKRSIERRLNALSRLFPLACDDRSQPYGWSWMADAQPFDVPGMDPETALTFVVLDRFARHLLPGNVVRRFAPHVQQAEAVLETLDGEHGPGQWPERVRFLSRSLPLHAPSVSPEVTDVVYRALLEGRCFRGHYRSRVAGATQAREYVVNPLGLVFRDQVAYLVATLWEYEDIRQLALHRFEGAALLDDQATGNADFNLDAYIAEGHFQIRETDAQIRLKARFSAATAQHLAETPLAKDQNMEQLASGWTEVTATVNDTAQLRWWLLGFGGGVEVLEPSSLREEVAKTLRHAAARYE